MATSGINNIVKFGGDLNLVVQSTASNTSSLPYYTAVPTKSITTTDVCILNAMEF